MDDASGVYEIVFAYDNLTGDFTNLLTGTIGVENYTGLKGTQFAYNDAALQTLEDGMAICFDWFLDGAPHVITFDVTVMPMLRTSPSSQTSSKASPTTRAPR